MEIINYFPKIKEYINCTPAQQIEKVIEEIKEVLQNCFDIFTKRHKIHRELECILKLKEIKNEEFEGNGITVVDNIKDNRIQLFFDTKPKKEIITYLKGKNWKWTPSKSCWQNWRNKERLSEIKKYFNL